MIRKITFLGMMILTFIFFGFGVSQSFAKARLTDFEEVDAYISTRMKELGIPGAALVIIQGDQIVHLKAFGVADASGRPVTPQTPFFTGSTGKSFTALAIMQLAEADKSLALELSDGTNIEPDSVSSSRATVSRSRR